ncbi:MAG: RluA family pseudouridine synthase [Wolbachia endosymbiont of Tyrophagus putrescentiae]|nr:RluA family pseudouridine synthase [Wolbachia endosymbiont of Tyrophagus putrescentiae]
MNTRVITVDDNDVRVDRYIRRLFPSLQQSLIEKYLRKGLIKVDTHKVKSNYKVSSGQTITIRCLDNIKNVDFHVKPNNKPNAKLLNILKENILYKDEYILAINKPAGMVVQGGKVNISDLLDQIEEGETFKIVHRLDRDTSGVIIFARNAVVAKYLMEEFKQRRIKKTYLALTAGIPNKDEGVIDHPLVKKYIAGQEKMVIDESSPQVAVTYFSILKKSKKEVAYLKLQPITGRTHQLRAHLAHINCPILGDGKYGGKKAFVDEIINKMHLHAYSLSLKLPSSKYITITAPISQHIEQSLNSYGLQTVEKVGE